MDDTQIVELYWARKESAIEETAAKYGIGADRAVNYNADSEGTGVVYASVARAVCSVRAKATLDESWSEAINEDYRRRSRK